ncbi:transglutaminase domain-containing protein [Chitinimonas sp. BJB300]|uniref:transglutaminase domain-containing protein n=1 Tax=Chitinimonas sp. BJB300 TaxID=1559339 RepID=UPI000C0D627F|nr:transglutaminase domain-containing protein [Chitinimonas sp. BJB300]PHV10931.1 hypothetical protein CSQ89_13485 [Chitinimonas sp. BJB300]TSJ86030.1 hypothetical protein FG002_016830 [Chitinimonas sp. BJB300]
MIKSLMSVFAFIIGAYLFFCGGVLYLNAVDNSLSEEDREYARFYLGRGDFFIESLLYEEEVKLISLVQSSVLKIAPIDKGIPIDKERELKDLYLAGRGECYDRSRAIEKLLRYVGFKTRHVALYLIRGKDSAMRSILTYPNTSHAVTEVLTKRGWLAVDSNNYWLSVDARGNPIPIEEIQRRQRVNIEIEWADPPPSPMYTWPFSFVYGLYSRHGRFYPPYNAIPDINYQEFLDNFFELNRPGF